MWHIDEENSDVYFEVDGDKVCFKVVAGAGGGSGGSGVYLIKVGEETVETDKNTYSALRILAEIAKNNNELKKLFLRKDKEEVMPFLLKFLKGAEFGKDFSIDEFGAAILSSLKLGKFGINELGDAILSSLKLGDFGIDALGAAILSSLKLGDFGVDKNGIATLSKVFANVFQSSGFKTGALGTGFTVKINEDGDSYIEVDRLFVRKIMEVVKLIIQELKHVGGQIILTPASMVCSKVEEFSTYYRCYFNQKDGDGREINNQFEVGDQARRQTFNVKVGVNDNFKNEYYWRLVVGVGIDYIDLSKADCDVGSTIPQPGDEIVQLGNRNSLSRQGAIVLAAHGEDSPYLKIYTGINSYNLSGKEKVTLSPSLVDIIADNIRFSTGESVKDYIEGMMQETWVEGKIYNAGTTLPFANCLVKAKNQTTAPPFALLKSHNGNCLKNAKTGNYIIVCGKDGKPQLSDDWFIIQDNNELINDVKTYTDSLFLITKDEISSKVSQVDYAVDKAGILNRISSAESSITQQSDEIKLRVTAEELYLVELEAKAYSDAKANLAEVTAKAYADGKITEEEARAIADATAKANAAISSSKTYTDSQILLTNAKIELKVSKEDVVSHGDWVEGKTYNSPAMVYFANVLFQAKNQTTEPPFNLLKNTNGNYLKNAKTGNYIIVCGKDGKPQLSADWAIIIDNNAIIDNAKSYADVKAELAEAQANLAETNAKAYADGQITESEAAAIAAAQAYADLKKIEAQAYADGIVTESEKVVIESARLYAEAKANLAEVTAKSYADGIVTEEEARAMADATDKAEAARIAAIKEAELYSEAQALASTSESKTYTDSKVTLLEDKISLKVSQVDYLVDKAGMELEIAKQQSKLLATGIDIELKKVTLTANTFLIQDNSGNPIAVFEVGADGKPKLKADYINADEITVNKLQTTGNATITIQNGLMEVFGSFAKNISFGVDDRGYAVLTYFDNAGSKLYDLGPNGIVNVPIVEEKWVAKRMYFLGRDTYDAIMSDDIYKNNIITPSTPTYYQYVSKRVAGVVEDPINDGLLFESNSKESKKLDGYYVDAYESLEKARHILESNNTGLPILIEGYRSKEPITDNDYLYYVIVHCYGHGLLDDDLTERFIWNG